MKTLLGLALAGALAGLTAPAFGQHYVEVSYSGVVDAMSYEDCIVYEAGTCKFWNINSVTSNDVLPGQVISMGQAFVGSFVYDAMSPRTSVQLNGHRANHLNSVSESTYSAPSFQLPISALPDVGHNGFYVLDDFNGFDRFQVQRDLLGSDFRVTISMSLADETSSVFNGLDVPRALSLSSFGSGRASVGIVRLSDGDQFFIGGKLTGLTFTSVVPEPSAAALMLLGGACLAAVAGRRELRQKR